MGESPQSFQRPQLGRKRIAAVTSAMQSPYKLAIDIASASTGLRGLALLAALTADGLAAVLQEFAFDANNRPKMACDSDETA